MIEEIVNANSSSLIKKERPYIISGMLWFGEKYSNLWTGRRNPMEWSTLH